MDGAVGGVPKAWGRLWGLFQPKPRWDSPTQHSQCAAAGVPRSLHCSEALRWWHCSGFAQGSSMLGMAAVQGQSHVWGAVGTELWGCCTSSMAQCAQPQHGCVLVTALLLGGADPFLILLAAVVIMVLVTISSTASLAGGLSEQGASPACSPICALLGCAQAAGAAVLQSSCGIAGEQCSPSQVVSGHRAALLSWAPLCCSTVLELPALGSAECCGELPHS